MLVLGNYKVLGDPVSELASLNYKGIYRKEPMPISSNSSYFLLWQKASNYVEPLLNMGITTELSIDELLEYAKLASKESGKNYEVVYFDKQQGCPYDSIYYGIDVIENNGYSMLGDGFFNTKGKTILFGILNRYFSSKLNQNKLFFSVNDAEEFKKTMEEIESIMPGATEGQLLHIVFAYKIVSNKKCEN